MPIHRPVLHPSSNEPWFQALPDERRAQMNREWREERATVRTLFAGEARRFRNSAVFQALIFLVLDWFCPGDGTSSRLLALLVGALLGLALERLGAYRLFSAIAGGFAFFLFEWLSRGGLSGAHLYWIVPAACLSGYLGLAREER